LPERTSTPATWPRLRLERRRAVQRVDVDGEQLDVAMGALRLRAEWTAARGSGSLGVAIATPLEVSWRARAGGADRCSVPLAGRSPIGLIGAVLTRRGGRNGMEDDMAQDRTEQIAAVARDVTRAEAIAAALSSAASGAGAVGPTTSVGDRSVVPLTETFFAGGYGGGGGASDAEAGAGAGGGGGGVGRSRTVAVVEVTPDGVAVLPVLDKTAIALAALGAGVGLLGAVMRVRRRR
jgi:uncharacterized spore protein YtfJ